MGLVKYYNKEKNCWEIVAAGDAANISLHNELLQDSEDGTTSTARAFQKINNKISKLEHNLAWIYLNGAKGGGGGSGSSTYTISLNDGKSVFYTSTNSITINLTINSGTTKKTFYVNAINMSNNKMLVDGESHTSMTPFNFTIPNLPSTVNHIYLQAYDSQDNYTELVEITVNVGSLSIVQNTYPSAIYTSGGNNNTIAGFSILNKTGDVAYLLTYKSRLSDPLSEVTDPSLENNFGADYITEIPTAAQASIYQVDFASDLAETSVGKAVTYKTILYSPTLGYTSSYFTNQITVSSGDSLNVILYDIGETSDEVSQYKFQQNNYCTFKVLLYYEKIDINEFYYRYIVYKGDTQVYQSNTTTMYSATSGSTNVNCPTTDFEIGTDYKLVFEACDTEDFTGTKYASATGYFSIIQGESGTLQDYKGNLLARFGSFNFPADGNTSWVYNIATSGDYAFTSWPVTNGYNKTTLNIHNSTASTGLRTNVYRYMNLTGNTYATIEEIKDLFPQSSLLSRSLFGTGFYIQVTYEYLTESPVDQTILSFGEYKDGSLYKGFEINSDYIRIAFGSVNGIQIETPVKAENQYPSSSTSKTRTVTVGLNVWNTSVKTGANTSQTTYYFTLYIDGVMTKCVLVPENVLTNADTGWLFGTPLYLGCRNDLSNQANCNIYDFKLYAQNQSDLAIVQNFISATEQAHLIQDSTTGLAIVDDILDTNLRNKNLFNKGSNTCLLCDVSTGEYLDAATMYQRIVSSYSNAETGYDLDYPVVYIEETATSSDMYQCVKAIWNTQDQVGGVAITKKNWPVRVTITTKYGTTVLESDDANLAPTIAIQGTSSLSYNSKNLELMAGQASEGVNKLLKVNGWLPENEFTLKADVVDSAHVNNVAVGSFVNNTDYIAHYENSGYSNSDNIGKKIKKTSEGFPCLVFVKYSNGSVDDGVNITYNDDGTVASKIGKTEFMGIYNFNLGRYAYFNLGLKKLTSYVEDTTKSDYAPQIVTEYTYTEPANIYSMEVGDNFGNPEELFTQADTTISEYITECRYSPTSEDAAYEAITKSLFEMLAKADGDTTSYPRKRRTVAGGYETIVENGVIQYWTSDSTSTAEETIEKNLNMEVARKYLVLALVFGLVDSVCKNMVFRTWDGTKWVLAFYDMDTAFKKDNGGSSSIKYDAHFNYFYNTEDQYSDAKNSYIEGVKNFPRKDQVDDDNWDYVYAGMCSVDGTTPNRLWKIITQCDSRLINANNYSATLPGYYWDLRNNYIKDPDTFIDEYFSSYVNRSGAIMYNYDYRQKYVSYNQVWKDGVGLVADTSASQTEFLDGTRISMVRAWFKKRINFLDSVYASFRSGTISSDSYIKNEWDSRQKASSTSITVKMAADQKCKIGYNVSSGSERYIWIDEDLKEYILQVQSEGNLWYLYGGSILTEIPNFNKFGWYNFTKAFTFSLIKELNLSNLDVSEFTGVGDLSNLENLKVLNMSGFKYSGSNAITLGLANNSNLQELYLNKSNISSFTLPSTGTLKILDLTDNTNISSIPTQSVNGISQSCLRDQSGLTTLRLAGTSISNLYNTVNGVDNSLTNLPSLRELTLPDTLQKITINNCGLLQFVLQWNSTSKTSPLTHVQISNCENLETLDLQGQNNLQVLEIYNCPNLKNIYLNKTNRPSESFVLDFTALTKLTTLNISSTTYITELDLTNSPDLNIIYCWESAIKSVKCVYNSENPIELPSSAFYNCGQLTNLEGYFEIQGTSVFQDCSSLDFDSLMTKDTMDDHPKLYLTFAKVNSFDRCFSGCSLLGSKDKWPETLIHRLNSEVSSIKEMFRGTSSNFAINAGLFSYVEDNEFKDLNVTDISGIFADTYIHGSFCSEYTDSTGLKYGLFQYMPELLRAESAFAGTCNIERYIDNNFFNFEKASKLQCVDYMFQNNRALKAVEDTNAITLVETPLHSKSFFINLTDCVHDSEKVISGTSKSEPNPDWPYPFEVFGGTGIQMTVDIESDGHPYLFHLANEKYKNVTIYLQNSLYSGIDLILDSTNCNYSYLFGGNTKTISDGTLTYYIPKFAKITSPFSSYDNIELDLSKIDGTIFFDSSMIELSYPFNGMKLTNTSTIPVTIFKGAQNITKLEGFFSGLGLNNLDSDSLDFTNSETATMFDECTSLKNISSLFAGCNEFRIQLASEMFKNCVLQDVSNAFANSRVYGKIPSRLFYMTSGPSIKTMSNIFQGCYNLGYDKDYTFAEVPVLLDGTLSNWYDHIVSEGTKLDDYTVPEDLFYWCTADADIAYVLGQLWWNENTIPDEPEGGIYSIKTNEDVWIGPNCKIPANILQGESLVTSKKLIGVFANTHFLPEGEIDATTYARGNLYPDGLFKNMTNLTNISEMFYGTIIDKGCVINKDLFMSDSSTYLPLTVLSSVWQNCTFTYKATDYAEDTGSAQIDFSMFDNYTTLTDISYMFAGEMSKSYGLHEISSTMFSGIDQTSILNTLNISNLFAYSDITVDSTAPLFKKAKLTAGGNTYLTGISPTLIKNAQAVKTAGLAPNTDEWNEYTTEDES